MDEPLATAVTSAQLPFRLVVVRHPLRRYASHRRQSRAAEDLPRQAAQVCAIGCMRQLVAQSPDI
jgi:hypothetical protein